MCSRLFDREEDESAGEETGLMAQRNEEGEENVATACGSKFRARMVQLKDEVEPLRQSLFCSSR